MAGCPAQSFSNVTQTVWDCLVTKAASYGVQITGPNGQASKLGFTFQWNWQSGAGTLMIQCTDKPFIVGCGTVEGEVMKIVTECGGVAS